MLLTCSDRNENLIWEHLGGALQFFELRPQIKLSRLFKFIPVAAVGKTADIVETSDFFFCAMNLTPFHFSACGKLKRNQFGMKVALLGDVKTTFGTEAILLLGDSTDD